MFDLRLGYKVTLSISHYVNFKLISKIIIGLFINYTMSPSQYVIYGLNYFLLVNYN